MHKKYLLVLFVLALLAPGALAHDDKPTVAILRTGPVVQAGVVVFGILDPLHTYGYLTEAELLALRESQSLEGERINIDIGYAVSAEYASGLVEKALDDGADAIVAITTQIAQAAINLTLDMDDPPAVFFGNVVAPYEAGLADASCIKPAHVTGVKVVVPYGEIMELLLLLEPPIESIGTIHTTSNADGAYGARQIARIADDMGLWVEQAGVVGMVDLQAAADSLASKGVDAFILPLDAAMASGIPIVTQVAVEHGIPFFYATPVAVYYGATVGGGSAQHYEKSAYIGLLLAAYLDGDLDIASTGIHEMGEMAVGVNLDMADLQGVTIADELVARATYVVDAGSDIEPERVKTIAAGRAWLAKAADAELLASLQCTPEMIAEQQAALDAGE